MPEEYIMHFYNFFFFLWVILCCMGGIALFDEKESNIRSSSKATSLEDTILPWYLFSGGIFVAHAIFHLQLYTLLELEVKLVAPKRVFTSTTSNSVVIS